MKSKLLKRLSQPRIGAALMLALLAAIELGQLAARLYSGGIDAFTLDTRVTWMLLSIIICATLAWRLLRRAMVSAADRRRKLLVVLLHALACWRFLSIELAVLATLPLFALAAEWLLGSDSSDD